MSWDTAVTAIRARVTANWLATPVAWPNEPFDKPEPPAPWLYVEIVAMPSALAGIGVPASHLFRDEGLIRCFVHVPSGSGDALARTHADAFAALFRTVAFDGVQTWAPTVFDGMAGDDNGNWWQVPVTVPFTHDYFG